MNDGCYPPPPRTGKSRPPLALRVPILAIALLLAALLPACKIVVTVPFGGKVVTEEGFECLSGQTCVIDVSDDSFDSTFAAVPDKGHSFVRWRRKTAAFCGDETTPCYLSTNGFAEHQALLDILDSDQEFFLEPVFVHYNLGYWTSILRQIEQGTFSTQNFLYAILPDPENCNPGALTDAARARALQAVNRVRALHYLPPVSIDHFYDMQVQETSLVQKANNYLNHFPAGGDRCYTQGASDGAATSNLSGGSGGGGRTDPASDIIGWVNDNLNIAILMEAGHRRWVLFPELGYTAYGQVEGFSTLKVFGFGMPPAKPVPASLEFVAMPYKSYPYVLVSRGASPTPWSLSMVPPAGVSSGFDFFRNASVKVVDLDTGKSLPVQNLHRDNKGFGLSNFLSWMVAGWDYDRVYRVTVSGINMPGGNSKSVSYPVMVDRFDLFNVNYPLEVSDQKVGNQFQGRFDTGIDRDSYTVRLAGSKTLSGRSEFSNQAFFILVYDAGKRLVASADGDVTRNFAAGKHTVVLSPCDESGLCYQGTQTYTVTIR